MSDTEYRKCTMCGKTMETGFFYKSGSEVYSEGYIPICKNCFGRKFALYNSEYHSSKMAMQRMCMMFDIYFDEDLFDKCDVTNENNIGNYLKKMNLPQYRNRTFDDTIRKGQFSFSGDRKITKSNTRVALVDEYGDETEGEVGKVPKSDIEKWGIGLSPVDYENLNSHYKFLKNANPHCDSNQETFINDLCYAKMQQLKCVREGDMDNFKKMGEYYNSTFVKSGLKALSEGNADGEDCLGVWNMRISQYTPEEYYKNKDLYKDKDGLGEYIKRFLLRPLRNLQYGTNERDDEYCVKEEREDEDESDENENGDSTET